MTGPLYIHACILVYIYDWEIEMLNRGNLVGKNNFVDDVVRNFASQMIILCMKFDTFGFLYICLTFISRLLLVCWHVICVNPCWKTRNHVVTRIYSSNNCKYVTYCVKFWKRTWILHMQICRWYFFSLYNK